MKYFVSLIALIMSIAANSQDLKATLLKQLKSTHNEKDWFVPANIAVEVTDG